MNTHDKIVKCRSCGYVGPCDPTCCEHPDYDGATAEEAWQAALQSQDHEDSARLDWIEKNARRDPDMGGNHTWWPTSFNKTIRGPSLRDAIDRARRVEGEAK